MHFLKHPPMSIGEWDRCICRSRYTAISRMKRSNVPSRSKDYPTIPHISNDPSRSLLYCLCAKRSVPRSARAVFGALPLMPRRGSPSRSRSENSYRPHSRSRTFSRSRSRSCSQPPSDYTLRWVEKSEVSTSNDVPEAASWCS